MRKRLPQHLQKRLQGLEKRRGAKRYRGCMLLPDVRNMPMAEWSRVASESQAELKRHAQSLESGPPKYSDEFLSKMANVRRIY